MNISKTLTEWWQRQINRSKAKEEALLQVRAKEMIQVREFDGSVYLSYMNTPVIKVENIKTSIADTLTAARSTYVSFMKGQRQGMEMKNIERASTLLPTYQQLTLAKKVLNEEDASIVIHGTSDIVLPAILKMNILNMVNCECERLRQEISVL